MPGDPTQPTMLLRNSLESGRIHSAYLISGAGDRPRLAATEFARGLACAGDAAATKPCEQCAACHRSRDTAEEVEIDGTGKHGPLYRHIGEHPDLFWTQRGAQGTRVRIDQIRALQRAVRVGANEGGWRVAVIADAEWLGQEAQNALLRLLEEPPDRTCIVLVSRSAAALLATIRSRCVRVAFPAEERIRLRAPDLPEEFGELVARLDAIEKLGLPELLDWAEEYRGNRASAAAQVQSLLEVGSAWLRECVTRCVHAGDAEVRAELDALHVLSRCRRDLIQRNANPQMIAERSLFAVREAVSR